MRITFLGTNGWYDSKTGETPCILIDAEEAYVVLDAGNSIRKLDEYIREGRKPIFIFLSHYHLDHVFGLHIMPKFAFPQGATIYGQPGIAETLGRLFSPPFTATLDMLCKKMPLDIKGLREGKNTLPAAGGPLEVETAYLVHKDPCFGYSFMLEGKKVAYCTDTGACGNIAKLGRGADLLITECGWKERNQSPDWPHMAPEDAAEAALAAGAKSLMLTHLDALQYSTRNERIKAQKRARKIFPNTLVAEDDMSMEL